MTKEKQPKVKYNFDPREFEILHLRYSELKTYREIGEHFAVSGTRIKQIELRTIDRLFEIVEPQLYHGKQLLEKQALKQIYESI